MNKFILFCVLSTYCSCTDKTEFAKHTFLRKGNEFFEKKIYDKAIFYYQEAISEDSTFIDAYFNSALVFEVTGAPHNAIEMYNKLLILDRSNEKALFKRATLYLNIDQYYSAMDDLNELKEVWKDSSILYFTKGLINTKLKNYDLAISEFKQSLHLTWNLSQSLINIGNVFYYKGMIDSAHYYLEKGLKISNNEANGYNTLGLIAIKKEEYLEAVLLLNKALKIEVNNPWYLNNKGFAYLKLGKLDSAEYCINTSLKIDPYNPWVYRNKGLLEKEKNNLTSSIRLLEKAYAIDSTIDNLIYDLAIVYKKNGNNNKACETIRRLKKEKRINNTITYCL